MNPFNLPGPQFLTVYIVLGAVVVSVVYYVKRQAEAGEPGRLPLSDPYVIAYLRGGAVETVRVAAAVLSDRQLLEWQGDGLVARSGVGPSHGANELERAILEECARLRPVSELAASHRLLEIARRSYEPGLVQLGLIAGPDVQARRRRDATVAIVALVLVAVIKIVIGLVRNRPVSDLVLWAIGFPALTLYLIKGMRTVRGDRILDDLKVLFTALRLRSSDLRPHTSSSELALLMGVFGFAAVPPIFPFVRVFRPDTSSSSSCGSSSSGCGGGSSCGGGGGGCGGCGS